MTRWPAVLVVAQLVLHAATGDPIVGVWQGQWSTTTGMSSSSGTFQVTFYKKFGRIAGTYTELETREYTASPKEGPTEFELSE